MKISYVLYIYTRERNTKKWVRAKKKTMILTIDNQSKEIKKEECIKYGMDLCIKLAIPMKCGP